MEVEVELSESQTQALLEQSVPDELRAASCAECDDGSDESDDGSDGSDDSDAGSEDSEEEPKIDYNSEAIHEEIECMLSGSNQDIMELIATDPKYYLDLVQNYTKTRDGRDIYLPDLFNILINRSSGRLTIKFKMSDNGQWYEIGFSGGEFNDDAVYKAFTEKVESLIKCPPPPRSEVLAETLKPSVHEAPPMINQGNQYKLTKIDRFLGRTEHAVEGPPTISAARAAQPEAQEQFTPALREQLELQGQKPTSRSRVQFQVDRPDIDAASDTSETSDTLSSVVRSFKRQLGLRLREKQSQSHVGSTATSLNDRLRTLNGRCPEHAQQAFSRLTRILLNPSPFVSELVDSLHLASRGQRVLIHEFLENLDPGHTHEQLADMLELSADDRQLLRDYHIDLTKL